MSGSSFKSPRGPLSKFGGPPSKSFYVCQICKKEIRRDKIGEHLGSNVDMDVLKLLPIMRSQHLARLPPEKRIHTEKVQDYYDENRKLPTEFTNSSFWIKVSPLIGTATNPIMQSFLSTKHSNTGLEDPPAKKQSTGRDSTDPEQEEDISEDEIEIADEVFETYTPSCSIDENLAVEPINKPQEEATRFIEREDIKNEIKSALVDALSDPEAAQFLAEQIADRIKKINADEADTAIDAKMWQSGEHFTSCIACIKHSDSDKVPGALKKLRKGNFGRLNITADPNHIKTSQKNHESNDLHKWCVIKCEELEKEKLSEEMKNKKAAENTVRNVLFALKNGGGSELFLSLMDKDNLTEGIEAPTKNDSKKTFFDLREIIFEEVDKRLKKMFSEIGYITVTLDKVTVGHVSYMVILTYFFHDGQIFICLNRLEKLQETDYDGPGTAAMLVKVLRDTTGWSKPQLANRLIHMTYDGVFAETEERVRGGGSLSLRSHVCTELGLEPGSISGDWDAAHNMQLTWADLIKKHSKIMKVANCYFDIMKEHKLGKVGTHFMNRAKELGYLVLTNKQYQTTRFVRALLRGLTAALRNLPTLEIVLNEEIREMELANKNDKVNK